MSAYTVAVLADSPVSYWRLDETSGTNAVDQQAAHAGTYSVTVGGGTGVATAGSLLAADSDAAIVLSSSQFVDFGDPAAFQLSTGTIECWVKTSQAADGNYHAILVKDNAFGLFLVQTTGTLGLFDWGAGVSRDSGKSISDSKSHHVVMTFQSGVTNGTIVYLDGQAVLTTTMTVSAQASVLRAGANSAGSQLLPGTFDEPAIYSTVLSATRVLAHYNAALLNVTASESVTVTDTPVLKGGAQPVVSQSVTLTDTPAVFGGAQPKPSESVAVSDTPVLKGGAQPKPSESLTVTDTPVVQGPAQPQASEALTVSETAVAQLVSFVSTSQAVTLTDTPAVFLPTLVEAAAEALTVTDTPTVWGGAQPLVSEAVTVSETTAVLLPFLLVAASQAVTLSETVAAVVPVTASVSESVIVTDSPALKGGAQPQASESLTVTDSPTVKGGAQPKVSESLSVTDTPVVQLPGGGAALSIHASEALSVTETLTPILPYLLVSATDTLAATDTPAVQALIRVAASEQITVSTTVRLPINYIDAQSGTLTFTGSATSSIGPDLNVTWKRQHLYYVDYRNWVRGP